MPRRLTRISNDGDSVCVFRRRGLGMSSALLGTVFLAWGLLVPDSAVADPENNLRDAMASARSDTACQPLRFNPLLGQAAEVFNRLTDEYLAHTATRVPTANEAPGEPVDPLPGLKDLGYNATKGYVLQGANKNEALAIKGVLLEGHAYRAIADCSYTDFGASVRQNERTGYILASVVLATE